MPEAERFTTLGRGNGFPFCTQRVDVDDAFRFLTLGGYNGEGTPDIELSRRNAMKLYWNSYKLEANAATTFDTIDVSVSDVILQNVSGGSDYDPNDEARTPVSRDCRDDGNFFTRNLEEGSAPPAADADADVRIGSFDIVRMFEDGEFIGFGVDGFFARAFSSVTELINPTNLSASVSWVSVVDEQPQDIPADPDDPFSVPTEVDFDISEVTVGGVQFLAFSLASSSSSDTATLSTSENSASAVIIGGIIDGDCSASISTMNFWTY